MKIALCYYTKTGNIKKLVQVMTRVLGVEALGFSHPPEERVDLLFLGNSYYAFSIDPEVVKLAASLDKGEVGETVNFGSAAVLSSIRKKAKKEADKLGIPLDFKEFHCKGGFKGIHRGRPNERDIRATEELIKALLQQENQ